MKLNIYSFFIVSILCIFLYASRDVQAQQNQLKITALVCSYNNEKFCKKNLISLKNQEYDTSKINYKIIYINDCSADNTGSLADYYGAPSQSPAQVQIVHNKTRKGALRNIYEAVNTLSDDTIVMLVDGDDWLAHNKVVERVAQEYNSSDIWLTYGQFINYPYNTLGCCRLFSYDVFLNNSFRNHDFISAHLKTFKAGLFKKIKKEDLVQNNIFFDVVSDVAFMIPMLEMAHKGHMSFISEVLYVYNHNNLLNDYKIKAQKAHLTERYIRSLKVYDPLENL